MLIAEIIERLKRHIKTDHNTVVARELGVTPQCLGNWEKRGTVPWQELYDYSIRTGLSLDWLIKGDSAPQQNYPVNPNPYQQQRRFGW